MVPVISDFLFPDAPRLITELASLNAVHDVFVLLADVRFAYEVPEVSAGWIEAFDIESGETRVLSRRELRRLGERVASWQDDIARAGAAAGLDVVRVGLDDRWEMETALATLPRNGGSGRCDHGEMVDCGGNGRGVGGAPASAQNRSRRSIKCWWKTGPRRSASENASRSCSRAA